MGGVGEEPQIPLARLFLMGARQLVDRLHERLAGRGWEDVRPAYGYVLGAVREYPQTVSEIAALLDVTKQAASKVVALMVEAGYVAYAVQPGDSRVKMVAITERGATFLADAEAIYRDLEGDWASVLGAAEVEALRARLVTVLRQTNGGVLPPVRPLN